MSYQESETLELKSSFGEWKEIIITLAAFANKSGGTIIIGLHDDGSSSGMQLGKGTLEDFTNKVKLHTDPVLFPSLNVKTHGLGVIVEVTVPASENRPVFAFERGYIRVGTSNQKLSTHALKEMIRSYSAADFDEVLLQQQNTEELDYNQHSSLLPEYAGKNTPELDFLKKHDLVNNKGVTAAVYLSYCKKNTRFPNAVVKAARFKGTEMVGFLDMHDFSGNLIQLSADVLEFVQRHTSMSVEIGDKVQRFERWEYPIPASRY